MLPPARHRALQLIKDEHRSLAAVIHALQFLVRRAQSGAALDIGLVGAILHYLTAFPERLHHPAEDRWLFQPLRRLTSEGRDALDRLEGEHQQGHVREVVLLETLNALSANRTGALAAFSEAVEAYAGFYWGHMVREETLIFPLAERTLRDADWQAAAAAFEANHDPLYGDDTAHDFEALFKRIVLQTPSPVGLGS